MNYNLLKYVDNFYKAATSKKHLASKEAIIDKIKNNLNNIRNFPDRTDYSESRKAAATIRNVDEIKTLARKLLKDLQKKAAALAAPRIIPMIDAFNNEVIEMNKMQSSARLPYDRYKSQTKKIISDCCQQVLDQEPEIVQIFTALGRNPLFNTLSLDSIEFCREYVPDYLPEHLRSTARGIT